MGLHLGRGGMAHAAPKKPCGAGQRLLCCLANFAPWPKKPWGGVQPLLVSSPWAAQAAGHSTIVS